MKTEQNKECTKNLVIPAGTTKIGDGAFRNCEEMESVVIPDGVREIGLCAFAGCNNLKTITFPKGIKKIWAGAFDEVNNLREINYAGSKEDWASFVKESGLDISIDSCVAKCTDGEMVLEGSTYFSYKEVKEDNYIVIPEGVTSIEGNEFSGSEYDYIESLTIPKSVKCIGANAFNRWLCEINYAGTKEEWNLINEEALSDYDFYSLVIKCKDGEIYLTGRSADSEENPEDYKRLVDESGVLNDF